MSKKRETSIDFNQLLFGLITLLLFSAIIFPSLKKDNNINDQGLKSLPDFNQIAYDI